MVSEQDIRRYFSASFNEQMTWIGEEVKDILHKSRKTDIDMNMIDCNKCSRRTINYLFEIIKKDPKNIAVLREVEVAEKELWAFLERKPGSKSEKEIFTYWHNYSQAYVAELESKPIQYFLMRGYDEFHDGDEWIGIYDSLTQLESAYKKAVRALEQEHKEYGANIWTVEHEKVMIHTFNKATGEWHYDIPYALLFPEKNDCSFNGYRTVKIVLDNVDMFMFKQKMIKRDRYGDYICDGTLLRNIKDESISVKFHVKHTYEIFEMMNEWWGDWNDCPNCKTMGDKAQDWQEKFLKVSFT